MSEAEPAFKIKLKLGQKSAISDREQPLSIKLNHPSASSTATATDRPRRFRTKIEPDSDEDESTHPQEEHLILRLPSSDPIAKEFREIAKKRLPFPQDFEIQFKDSRHGVFKWKGENLLVKLVDLPCIIESQKTIDRKQFYKVADICQMIKVSRAGNDDSSLPLFQQHQHHQYQTDDLLENSGITPPLKYCRYRRFQKRVNRRTLESIEREVARLLKEDANALHVETSFIDSQELEDRMQRDEEAATAEDEETATAEDEELQVIDEEDESEAEASVSSGVELVQDTQDRSSDESEDEEEEDLPEDQQLQREAEEDLDPELQMIAEQKRLTSEELRDLENKISEKVKQRDQAMNALVKKRFDDIVKRLNSELEIKKNSLAVLDAQIQEYIIAKQEEEEFRLEQEAQEADLEQDEGLDNPSYMMAMEEDEDVKL